MGRGIAEVQTALESRYLLERELGRGGMATVYLALDTKLQRRVALKVLRPELAASLGNERFLREIAIAARLSHPHILPLHDSGEADGHLYYAMPYVEGESLRQRLEREGQLPVADVIAIARAVASALTYAHQHGVIHRDIKPENILLAKDASGRPEHPLVADFGIARALDAAGGERLTETGLALGTPAYMSPEQAAAGSRLDGRSDIYALGCVAYEMLAGSPPFTGPTAQSILARHAVDPVPPLHTVRETVPEPIEYAITRALAKVPADRFSTADEFAQALVAEHAPPSFRRRSTPRRPKLAIGVTIGAVALGGGAMMLRGSASPPVIPSATTIAVLPFLAAGSDTALSRLGRDLAITISATLDGVGEIKTADRLSLASATAGKQSASPAEGAALARRFGASSFLRGTLVRAGDNIRLDAGLYDVKGLAPIAEGITVGGNRDSLAALTDSVVWSLLRQVWQRGEPPSPSLTAVTTRSLPALRAFLQGERELEANQWENAALAFGGAMAADTNFWLAHFRYTMTRWWIQEPVQPDILRRLRENREVFAERERLLVDAFLTSERTPGLRIDKFRATTQRYPDYWPAWFLYADALFHAGPILGYAWPQALEAFRRVVILNPKLVPAWEHIFHLTLGRDHAEAAAAYARLRELGWPPPKPPGMRLIIPLEVGIGRAGGVIPPDLSRLADSVAANMVSSNPPEDVRMEGAPLGQLMLGFPAAQVELNRRALSLGRAPPRQVTALRAASAWAWGARGRWDSALTILSEVAAGHPGPIVGRRPLVAVESYGLAVVGSWLGATPPDLADQRRPGAVAAVGQLADTNDRREQRCRLAWFDGLLAFARQDRQALQEARAEALRTGYYQADLVDRSLGTFETALKGNRKRAGRDLAELENYCLTHESCNSFVPYTGVQRFAAAQWLRESGDLETASRMLVWADAPSGGWLWTLGDVLAGPAYLVRAQIEEARGAKALARQYYQQFLRRYDQPMASQIHLVQEAKAALARLQQD
jgi:tRNA A-37 threonylcarbamoyl transferase component Bud32/TolB-like protein/tetratricopeptide (TPR) repeat protein